MSWLGKNIEIEDLLSKHAPISKKLLEAVKALSGAKSLIEWCYENKLPIALVSSSTSKSVAYKCKSHKWIELLNVKVLGDDPYLRKGKPAPDPYLLAAKRLGVNPKMCYVIEDSESGIQAGLNAGCLVWVLKPKHHSKNGCSNDNNINNPIYIRKLSTLHKYLIQESVSK